MRFGDRRTGSIQKFLESAATQVPEQHPRSLVRKLRMLPLHLRESASRYPKEVRQAVVVQVGDAVAPTNVSGLDTQPGAQRDVLKHKVARVPVQSHRIFGKMSLQRVQPAVGIEIANGDAHPGLFV